MLIHHLAKMTFNLDLFFIRSYFSGTTTVAITNIMLMKSKLICSEQRTRE
jgi:hypothetical protein